MNISRTAQISADEDIMSNDNIPPRKQAEAAAKALRKRGHEVLAAQVKIAARHPENKAVRKIVGENIERAAKRPR